MGYNEKNKKMVDAWNKIHPKEILVRHFINGDPDDYELIMTKSKAMLTYLPYPVILLSGRVKLVNLNYVTPVEKEKS